MSSQDGNDTLGSLCLRHFEVFYRRSRRSIIKDYRAYCEAGLEKLSIIFNFPLRLQKRDNEFK